MKSLNMSQLNQVAGGVRLGASNVDVSTTYLSSACQTALRTETTTYSSTTGTLGSYAVPAALTYCTDRDLLMIDIMLKTRY